MMTTDQQPLEESATQFSLQLSAVAESAAVQENKTGDTRIEMQHSAIVSTENAAPQVSGVGRTAIDGSDSPDSGVPLSEAGGAVGKKARKSSSPGSEKGGRVHQCARCNQTFSRCHNLKTHQLIHTGDKPFECKQCHAVFSRAYDLRRHEKSHTGEKPYVCMYCHRGFSRLDALNRHMRVTGADGVQKAPCAGTNNSFPARSRIMVMNTAPNGMAVPSMVADGSNEGSDIHDKRTVRNKRRTPNAQDGSFGVVDEHNEHGDDVSGHHVEFDPSNPATYPVHPVHFANFTAFSQSMGNEGVSLYYAAAAAASASTAAGGQVGNNPAAVLVNAHGTPLTFPYPFAMPTSTAGTSQTMTPPVSHNPSLSNSPTAALNSGSGVESKDLPSASDKGKLEGGDKNVRVPATPEPDECEFSIKHDSSAKAQTAEHGAQNLESDDGHSASTAGHNASAESNQNAGINQQSNLNLPYFPASMYFGGGGTNGNSIPSFFLPTTVSVHDTAMATFDNATSMVHGDMSAAAYFSDSANFNFDAAQSVPANSGDSHTHQSPEDVKFVGISSSDHMSNAPEAQSNAHPEQLASSS